MNGIREHLEKTIITTLVSSAVACIVLALGAYITLLSLDSSVSALENSDSEQNDYIQNTIPQIYVRQDVQTEKDKRLEGKIDLLLNEFGLVYRE